VKRALLALLLPIAQLWGECAAWPTQAIAFERADFVFHGKVVGITDLPRVPKSDEIHGGDKRQLIVVDVIRQWKGSLEKRVNVYSYPIPGQWSGFTFQKRARVCSISGRREGQSYVRVV